MMKLTLISVALMVSLCASAPADPTPTGPTTTRKPFVKLSCKGHKSNGFFVDEKDPHIFHECVNGEHIADFSCGVKLVFDEVKQVCVEHVDTHSTQCPQPNGLFPYPEDRHKFIECNDNTPYIFSCPGNLVFDPREKICVFDDNTHTDSPVTRNPDKFDCSGKPDGEYADPEDKHKFVECTGGRAFFFSCPGNLIYDPANKTCTYDNPNTDAPSTLPPKTDATTREPDTKPPVTETVTKSPITDSPTVGPTKSPVTDCTKDGMFADPSDKHKYIICSKGQKVEMTCPAGMVYNEALQMCT